MEAYQRLEAAWAEFNGYRPEQVVACSSGTAALHLALESLQLPPGSKVIVPDYCMVACARAVTLAELEPVFVDCDDSLLMNQSLANDAIDDQTSAMMIVHIYGRQQPEMGVLNHFGNIQGYKLPLIEDLAELHGVKTHPMTDAACWSFYRNKIVAGEEGGAVAFRDVKHARLARQLRSLGFTDAHDFYHVPRGHNYRLANCLAQKVLPSIRDYTNNMPRRRQVEAWYDELCPVEWKMPPRDVPWIYDLRLKLPTYDGVGHVPKAVAALNATGIMARQGFKAMREQAEYREPMGRSTKAYWASLEMMYLPITPTTKRAECVRAFEVLRSVVGV